MAESEDRDAEGRELPPSERRLEQAREEGQVARSQELGGFVLLLLGAAALYGAGGLLVERFGSLVRGGLAFSEREAFDPARLGERLAQAGLDALLIVAPFLGGAMLLALAAPLCVGGWNLSAKALEPDFQRLDPLRGLGRIFSLHGLGELVKTLAKAGLVIAAAGLVIGAQLADFAALLGAPFAAAVHRSLDLVAVDALLFAAVLGIIAAVDVPWSLWRYQRELRMSPDEVRREQKESEGDPQIKARVRSLQRARARNRMMAEVPKASVVVTNPTHYSVALAYDDARMLAPRVVAKGAGHLAQRIRELADEHGVPRVEALALARALYRHAEIEAEIPQALFTAVAQVLAHVYGLRAARAAGWPDPQPPEVPDVPPEFDFRGAE